MAHLNLRRPQNVSGDFYVDTSCIDCDTCRWMAKEVFFRDEEQSAVHHQPTNETERLAALQALLSCPHQFYWDCRKTPRYKSCSVKFPHPCRRKRLSLRLPFREILCCC